MIIGFIADQGKYTAQAHFLLQTLLGQPEGAFDIVIGIPHEKFEDIRATFGHYRNVEFVRIKNEFESYPHANKIYLTRAIKGRDFVFLDTDILCVGNPLRLYDYIDCDVTDVFVKPADKRTWGNSGSWDAAYKFFGMGDEQKIFCTTEIDQIQGEAYYNAGFIYFKDPGLMGEEWLSMAQSLEKAGVVDDIYPWLDQITLPLVLAKSGVNVAEAPSIFNFSAFFADTPEEAVFAHYHFFPVVGLDPVLMKKMQEIRNDMVSESYYQKIESHMRFASVVNTLPFLNKQAKLKLSNILLRRLHDPFKVAA